MLLLNILQYLKLIQIPSDIMTRLLVKIQIAYIIGSHHNGSTSHQCIHHSSPTLALY